MRTNQFFNMVTEIIIAAGIILLVMRVLYCNFVEVCV